MEKLRLKLRKSPRKRKGDAEEIELREASKRSASDETEHPQESTLTETKAVKDPKLQPICWNLQMNTLLMEFCL